MVVYRNDCRDLAQENQKLQEALEKVNLQLAELEALKDKAISALEQQIEDFRKNTTDSRNRSCNISRFC